MELSWFNRYILMTLHYNVYRRRPSALVTGCSEELRIAKPVLLGYSPEITKCQECEFSGQGCEMLGQIPPTPYDLRFFVVGIPVRVHPIFWLTSAFLAWEPERMDLVVTRVLCIFVAILVHELGHAIVTRAFGWQPEIVLYFFGGYATTGRHSTWKNIAVSAAGPTAGLSLYILTKIVGIEAVKNGVIQSDVLIDAIGFSLFINQVWNFMNLVPVLPLDGGQISREFFCWLLPRGGMDLSLKLSVAASGGLTLWSLYCMSNEQSVLGLQPGFLAIMFGYLCYQGLQQLQSRRKGYW